MFYVNFINLCAKKNVTSAQVAREIGVSGAAISKWKNGGMPTDITMAKLADYFDVSVDYLLGNEKKPPETNPGDLIIADEDIIRIQRARSKMNDSEKAHMMQTLTMLYQKYFDEDFEDTDTEE